MTQQQLALSAIDPNMRLMSIPYSLTVMQIRVSIYRGNSGGCAAVPKEPTGSDWTTPELILVVADYLSMLRDELDRRPYSKADHRRHLLRLIQRSEGSIEFKHQNISAILKKLGLPWIEGYKPRSNYQGALLDAIEAQLGRNPFWQEVVPVAPPSIDPADDSILVPAPSFTEGANSAVGVDRLIRKFDPAERDARNRRLGKAGEAFVFELERRRLEHLGRRELAAKVRWVSDIDGDGAGYDILSFNPEGQERLLEVKTTCGAALTPFYLTRNELSLADERPMDFRLVRLHQFASSPKIFVLSPPLTRHVRIEPIAYSASWG